MKTLTTLALVAALAATIHAETIYSVSGTTMLNVDGSGEILGVSGTLVGNELDLSLLGTLTIDTVGAWPVDATLVASAGAVPPFAPAQATLLSPDSSGPTLQDEAEGLTLNFIEFSRTDPFSYETLDTWGTLLTYFGTAGADPVAANLQLVEVCEPTTGLLGLLGCMIGLAAFRVTWR